MCRVAKSPCIGDFAASAESDGTHARPITSQLAA